MDTRLVMNGSALGDSRAAVACARQAISNAPRAKRVLREQVPAQRAPPWATFAAPDEVRVLARSPPSRGALKDGFDRTISSRAPFRKYTPTCGKLRGVRLYTKVSSDGKIDSRAIWPRCLQRGRRGRRDHESAEAWLRGSTTPASAWAPGGTAPTPTGRGTKTPSCATDSTRVFQLRLRIPRISRSPCSSHDRLPLGPCPGDLSDLAGTECKIGGVGCSGQRDSAAAARGSSPVVHPPGL